MSQLKTILVPTDFSPASNIAFDYALDLAAGQGSSVHLLHVLDDGMFVTAYPDGAYTESPGLRAQLVADATRRLSALAEQCRIAQVTATVEVAIGRPSPVIAARAAARNSDLIVMGTHGRSGFAHLLLGSVAERLVRTAPCAVLTVRDTSRTADRVAADAVARRQGQDIPNEAMAADPS